MAVQTRNSHKLKILIGILGLSCEKSTEI